MFRLLPRLGCAVLALPLLSGCPQVWPEFVTCDEIDACGTSGSTSSSGEPPTTTEHIHTVTGDSSDADAGSTTPNDDTSAGTSSTTDPPAELPKVVKVEVTPDFIDKNGLITVTATTTGDPDGVHMKLYTGQLIELTPIGDKFTGQIPAFTSLTNGKRTAVLTPWRDVVVGESVDADYVVSLPPTGYEISWQTDLGAEGNVAAIEVLPDGRPVEFGTLYEMGVPRCYLRLHDKTGAQVEPLTLLPATTCTAIDLTIDRVTGVIHVLLMRKSGDDLVWWVGEISSWGSGPKNIGTGEVGDKALALAARPGVVAVCGWRPVAPDTGDSLAVLLRPDELPDTRVFDYTPKQKKKPFTETARDCKFAGDTLIVVGEARGKHTDDFDEKVRDRVMILEYEDAAAEPKPFVSSEPGIQSGALALDIDDIGRYHLAVYTCLDVCEREGKYRIYAPGGGEREWDASLGLLGSDLFGPHDIAWNPAGYAVFALGAMQGQSQVFKVQAFTQGNYKPLWIFIPNDKQGLQLALAVAIGLFGEVYAGGIGAGNHPAFAVIGG